MDQPFLLHRHFDDFDDYCVNAQNWDLDYRQIESGPFSCELLMAGNGTALYFSNSCAFSIAVSATR
jgi:hypothetical protein